MAARFHPGMPAVPEDRRDQLQAMVDSWRRQLEEDPRSQLTYEVTRAMRLLGGPLLLELVARGFQADRAPLVPLPAVPNARPGVGEWACHRAGHPKENHYIPIGGFAIAHGTDYLCPEHGEKLCPLPF